jgi:murein DD-endopeptidase MepM/ murein hydrolase activator NlpD
MSSPRCGIVSLLGSVWILIVVACSPAGASTNLASPVVSEMPTGTLIATTSPRDSTQAPLPPELTGSPTLSPTSFIYPTLAPSATRPLPSPTPCIEDLCTYASQFFLHRPIALPGNDAVDITYRFGSTQGGLRDPHHGVEFLNSFGTPVLAAADGTVVVAGSDLQPTSPQGVWPITFYGPYSNFYGNLVVIEHKMPPELHEAFPQMTDKLYTLYGHLSEISVEVGQQVQAGDEVGRVGMSGIAEGSHLHFEVRLGENTYASARNPELWLVPHQDKSGQPLGALAGSFIDSYGNNLFKDSIVLQHLPDGPDNPGDFQITVLSYEENALIGQLPWQESFAVGDLPPGLYRVSFPHFGLRQELVQVFPGRLTLVTFRLE